MTTLQSASLARATPRHSRACCERPNYRAGPCASGAQSRGPIRERRVPGEPRLAATIFVLPRSDSALAVACTRPRTGSRRVYEQHCTELAGAVILDSGKLGSQRPSATYAKAVERRLPTLEQFMKELSRLWKEPRRTQRAVAAKASSDLAKLSSRISTLRAPPFAWTATPSSSNAWRSWLGGMADSLAQWDRATRSCIRDPERDLEGIRPRVGSHCLPAGLRIQDSGDRDLVPSGPAWTRTRDRRIVS